MANERLRALEEVEKEIAMILQCAGEDSTATASFHILHRLLLLTVTILNQTGLLGVYWRDYNHPV